jgi:hypothetical protein
MFGQPGALQQGAQQFGQGALQGGQPMQGGFNPATMSLGQAPMQNQQRMQQPQNAQLAGKTYNMGGPVGMAPPNPYEQQVGQEDPRMQAMRRMQMMNFGE